MKKLLEKYKAAGIILWEENGQLRFRAPKGAMTDERKKELKDNKQALIAYFSSNMKSVNHDEEDRYTEFPLTDIQAAYLVGKQGGYEYGGVGCKVYSELTLEEIVDVSKLEKAWHEIVKRHDMLHTMVYSKGVQKTLKDFSLPPVKVYDLRNDIESAKKFLTIRKELTEKQYGIETWPLFDLVVTLLKDKTIIHFSIDMLIADFVSITVILEELEQLYFGQEIEALEITFRDILLYQEKQKEKTRGKAEQYWNSRIATLPAAPELPAINKIDDESEEISFEQFNYFISKEQAACLQKIAHKTKLTLTGLILAVYAKVISKWSSRQKFCLNVTMLNRPDIHPQINKIVGDFTVTDILEIDDSSQLQTFEEFAKSIQLMLWKDMENMSVSGVEVLRKIKNSCGRDSIQPVVFTSTIGAEKLQKSNRKMKMTYKMSQTPQVWIDCQVSEQQNELLVNWDVRKGIFPEGMIENAFETFTDILKSLAKEEVHLDRITSLRLPDKMEKVRKETNNTQTELTSECLYTRFVENATKMPRNIAIIEDNKQITYGELYSMATAIKENLENRGSIKGEVVAIAMERSSRQIATILGVLMSGGIYLPLDTENPVNRLLDIIKEGQIKRTICEDQGLATELRKLSDVVLLNFSEMELVCETQGSIADEMDCSKPAYVIYTSGSTGIPKGVVITHEAAINTIRDINKKFSITKDDIMIGIAGPAFDLSVYDIFGTLSLGAKLVLPKRNRQLDIEYLVKLLDDEKVTIWNSTPAVMQMLVSYLQTHKKADLSLRKVLLSGDWIPVTLPTELYKILPNVEMISLGGATEASIWSIFYRIEKGETFEKSIPYGKPLANQYFRVLNERLEDCPDGVTGELYIGGHGLAEGYYRSEGLTAEKFINLPQTNERLYKTGDKGKYREDGNIIFLGREDNQIKIKGHRIELNEISTVLRTYPQIEDAVVINTNEGNGRIHAFVKKKHYANTGYGIVEKEDLRDICLKAGNRASSHVDRKKFAEWAKASARAGIFDILKTFQNMGIFVDCHKYTYEEILQLTKAQKKYYQLIKRWINALQKENVILYSEDRYELNGVYNAEQISEEAWKQWRRIEADINYGHILLDYFEASSSQLTEILRGEVDQMNLFFPEGDFKIAKAAYHDNLMSRITNSIIVEVILAIIHKFRQKGEKRTFKILEIGAGVGGTSIDLIPALEEENVEYIFTDISKSFLNQAMHRFSKYDWIKYSLFDINEDYHKQGLKTNEYDLILSANVLHNAKNGPIVMKKLSEMGIPGGSIVVVDATGENYSLLTSMEFHNGLSDFEDFRKDNEQVFFEREQWENLFKVANIDVAVVYPSQNDTLSYVNQAVFVGQFSNDSSRVTTDELKEYVMRRLPQYMVPDTIDILEAIPLSKNGKINRNLLKEYVQFSTQVESQVGKPPHGKIEKSIAKIWKKALNRKHIWRDENFYEIGGDSLLAAQVVAAMREDIQEAKSLEWDALMLELLKNPTIESIAKRLSDGIQSTGNGEVVDDSLIFLENGERDSSIVLFHDGTGTLTPYDALLNYLKSNTKRKSKLYGVVFGDESRYLSYESENLIYELGQEYGKELLKTGDKQFTLAGYCMGGLIALETAKVLIENNCKIRIIAIDTTPCNYKMNNELLMERTFGMLIGADIEKAGHWSDENLLKEALFMLFEETESYITTEQLCALSGKYESVGKCFRELAQKSKEERLNDIYKNIPKISESMTIYQEQRLKILFDVFCKSFQGVALYGAAPFVGDVTALGCKDKSSAFMPVAEGDNEAFWKEITFGKLNYISIEGNHFTCMKEPHVKEIAEFILEE